MAFIKSLIYLLGFGAVGLTFLQITSANKSELEKKLRRSDPAYQSDAQRKKQEMLNILRGAAQDSTPIYRKTKEEVEAIKKEYVSGDK